MWNLVATKVLSNKFLKGSFIFSVASFGVSVLNYVFNLIVARGFSLSDYGEYLSAISYVTMLGIPFGALTIILIKKIGAKDPHHRHSYAVQLEKWLFGLIKDYSLLVFAGMALLFLLLSWKANLHTSTGLFIIFLTLTTFLQVFYFSVLQAYKAFLFHGILLSSIAIAKVLGALGVINFSPSLNVLYAVFLAANILGVVFGHFLIRKGQSETKKEFGFGRATNYLTRKATLVPLLTTLGLIGLANVDVILVKKFLEADQAGLYGALSLLAKVILYFVTPVTTVAYTFFTGKESEHQSTKIVLLVVSLFGFIGLGSIGFYAMFPDFIVNLFFGEKFLIIAPLLWMGAIYGSLYSLVTFFSHYYMAKQSYWGFLALLALVTQSLLLILFHANLTTVLVINIGVTATLLTLYSGLFVYQTFK